jgi:phospholipid/cholesterol/gamma-HCH transport system ATP-binding protein
MNENDIIRVDHLTAAYGGEVILKDVSFAMPRGEILFVMGKSGSGKSSLLKHMIGLEPMSSGRVLIDGVAIDAGNSSDFVSLLKKIGVLFQGGALIGYMTVAENVALPIREHLDLPEKYIRDMVQMKLRLVDLDGCENRLPRQLSGGMRKRAALARAMALNPEILFLDEPSSGLDPVTSAEIDELLLRINQSMGTTLFIISHDLASIFSIARRVIMLDQNEKGIIADGDPFFLKSTSSMPEVKRFFNPKGHAMGHKKERRAKK